jgi:hypothetical protein
MIYLMAPQLWGQGRDVMRLCPVAIGRYLRLPAITFSLGIPSAGCAWLRKA